MGWWILAGWGLFGGFITDGIEFWRLVRNNGGSCPAHCLSVAFFIAEAIRLLIGAGLAVAFGQSGQISGPIAAVAIGAAAPLIVEKLAQLLPTLPASVPGDNK